MKYRFCRSCGYSSWSWWPNFLSPLYSFQWSPVNLSPLTEEDWTRCCRYVVYNKHLPEKLNSVDFKKHFSGDSNFCYHTNIWSCIFAVGSFCCFDFFPWWILRGGFFSATKTGSICSGVIWNSVVFVRYETHRLKGNETPPTHNNRSRGAGGLWMTSVLNIWTNF